MREILEIRVRITGEQRVQGCTGGAGMVLFGGTADSAFFHGVILPGGVDTQKEEHGVRSLSARYLLEGTDAAGQHCRIFIENNAVLPAPGAEDAPPMHTQPRVFTDSAALQWLETAPLDGLLYPAADGVRICILG